MADKLPTAWKNCATCSYWCGRREADFAHMWVTTYGPGKCCCFNSGWNNREREPRFSCASYDTWGPYKK